MRSPPARFDRKLKFYSRNEKPNLCSIVILTLITTGVLLLMLRSGESTRLLWANGIMAVYFALVSVFFFIAFQQQIAYNPYSYNTIFFSGFGFFVLFMVFDHLYMLQQCIKGPEIFTVADIFFILLNSGKNYLLLTAPLLVTGALVLMISDVILLRKTKDYYLHNFFGLMLGGAILFGLTGIGIYAYLVSKTGSRPPAAELLVNIASAMYLYFECMFIGTIIACVITSNYKAEPDKDFLIILGCGLEKDGTPSSLLQKRINTAISFAEEQRHLSGKEAVFVTSGGQGADEIMSEASAMKNYLLSNGIPEQKILTEDRSRNTEENIRFSKKIIEQEKPDAGCAFVTTNFHIFRSGLKANLANMRIVGISAPTNWFYLPNATAREFIGLLAASPKKQAAVFSGLILFYILMAFLIRMA